jgi:UDP-N-acetyl-D-mannosaminuronic acid dehydrogenase
MSRPPPKKTSRRAVVTVVGGAGHVGIPLVLCFADRGFDVVINDRNPRALDMLKQGELPFIEDGAQPLLERALARGALRFGDRPQDIAETGPVIVTIGTPVDEFLNPVVSAVKDCIDELLPHIADGRLIVLRSTLYPGSTDWLAKYIESKGRRLPIAYCPERVVQGRGVPEILTLPQIVSGASPEAEAAAVELFAPIAPEMVCVKPIEAEFAKLFTNAYRYVEFATTNQFFMIADSAGADYTAILRAMKTNYPRAAHIPGPGFSAGPCLFKDTMQLAAFSGNQFGLGHAAMLVNEGLILHIVEQLRKTYDLGSMTVGLLGMAFKADIDDVRSSLSYKLKKSLVLHAGEVLTTDPFVKSDPELLPLADVVARSDVLILCTPHSAYRHLDVGGKTLIDIWSFVQPPALPGGLRLPPADGIALPPALDIVIPVYNEGANILHVLSALEAEVQTPARVLICYDSPDDDTLPAIRDGWRGKLPVITVQNQRRGAHGAVMSGLRASTAPYVVVFPGDDDYNAGILDKMVAAAEAGSEIVCASRFMRGGGGMVGCPWLKACLVHLAAFSLNRIAGLPTHDPTNGFRLFSRRVIGQVQVESTEGFTFSLELLVKAHRLGWCISEVPARWFERRAGQSRFRVLRWLPAYLKWYRFAFATTFTRQPESVQLNKEGSRTYRRPTPA